eukprot:3839731-Pyramimonas_sp.AAC.1
MAPQELLEHDWLHLAGAMCVAPRGPTCLQAVPATALDYFLAHRPMLQGARYTVDVSVTDITWP